MNFFKASVVAVAVLGAASLGADIERVDATNAIINYMGANSYKEFAERSQKLFSQAPSLITTLEFGVQIKPTLENAQTILEKSLVNDILYSFVGQNHLSDTDYLSKYSTSMADMNVANLYDTLVISKTTDDVLRRFIKNIVVGVSAPGGATSATLGDLSGQDASDFSAQIQQSLPSFTTTDASSSASTQVSQRMHQAILSIPNYSLLNMYAIRNPSSSSSEESALSMMEREALWRYSNPTWLQEMAKTPTEGLLRELAHMNAYSMVVDYERFRQNERLEGLLAALVSTNLQLKDSLDKMASASGLSSLQGK